MRRQNAVLILSGAKVGSRLVIQNPKKEGQIGSRGYQIQ